MKALKRKILTTIVIFAFSAFIEYVFEMFYKKAKKSKIVH